VDQLLDNSSLDKAFKKERYASSAYEKVTLTTPTFLSHFLLSLSFSLTTNERAKAQSNYQHNCVPLIFLGHF
jgi:hypothetical protein